jgi:hypothetical protein
MKLLEHIKKNIVRYLVYFFILVITYGLIEYVFFAPYVEGLTKLEETQIDAKITKKIIGSNKKMKKKNQVRDDDILDMKKTIIDLEADMQSMKTSAEEGEEQGEAVKAELVASMPSGLNVKSD